MKRVRGFLVFLSILLLISGICWGANFYPFSGGLDNDGGTGELQDRASTENGDAGFVMLENYTGAAGEGAWYEGAAGVNVGNVFVPYVLDVDGGAGDSWPQYGNSGDGGNERWEYAGLYQVKTEFIPAGWMDITDGGADPPSSTYSTAANSREYRIRTFDGATDEDATFIWVVPTDLVGGYIKVRWLGIVTNATGPSNEVIEFEIGAVSLADGEEGGHAGTTDTAVQKTGLTADQDDLIMSSYAEVTGITALTAGEIAHFHVNRDADGGDTYAQDFGLIGIEIKYKSVAKATY